MEQLLIKFPNLLTAFATLSGVIIGGIITYQTNIGLIKTKEKLEAEAITKSILTELEMLKYIFVDEFAPKLLTEDKYLFYTYPLDTDYFVIYHSNASQIGKIRNDKLRETIIALYTLAKFFIDCLKANNLCIEYYEQIEQRYNDNGLDNFTKENSPDYQTALYRLELSKKDNLIPAFDKLKRLFEVLDKVKHTNTKELRQVESRLS